MELESAVTRTIEDAEKLKHQIESILAALIKKSEIVEIGLTSIDEPEKENSSFSFSNGHLGVDDPTPEFEQLFCQNGKIALPSFAFFTIVETETFLIPYMDKWIWGTTVLNRTEDPANLPELHLMVTSDSGDRNLNHIFTYKYCVSLAEVSFDALKKDKLEDVISIPFHDIFRPDCGPQSGRRMVQPGCKALVTACFEHPVRSSNKISLTASIFCDKRHQWSTSFEIKNAHAFTLYKEETFEKFHYQILSILTWQHQDLFKLERRFSQKDKSPAIVFKNFLAKVLGFKEITSVQIGFETWIDILTSTNPSLLFGLLIKIERNLREIDASHCAISARSSEQMHIFLNMFSNWIKQESSGDRKSGLKGLFVSNINQSSNQSMKVDLSKEVELIEHMISLTQSHMMSTPGYANKWLLAYLPLAAKIDAHFMCKTK